MKRKASPSPSPSPPPVPATGCTLEMSDLTLESQDSLAPLQQELDEAQQDLNQLRGQRMTRSASRGQGGPAPKRARTEAPAQRLVAVAGLLCDLGDGRRVVPQDVMFAWDASNAQQEEQALGALEDARAGWGGSATVFRATCDAGEVPTVVGGLTQGFKTFTLRKSVRK